MGGKVTKPSQPPKREVSQIDRAILDLKVSRDRLTRYKKKLNLDSTKLLSKAKTYKSKNTSADTKNALNLLKLRKLKLKEVDNIDSQLLTLQGMVSNIQSKEEEKEVLAALRTGKNALEKLHAENSLEDVMNLMDDVQEQNELEEEINNVLVNTGETLTLVEEDELELELQALMEGDVTEIQAEVPPERSKLDLPEVPVNKLPEVQNKVDEEATKQPARVAVAS